MKKKFLFDDKGGVYFNGRKVKRVVAVLELNDGVIVVLPAKNDIAVVVGDRIIK